MLKGVDKHPSEVVSAWDPGDALIFQPSSSSLDTQRTELFSTQISGLILNTWLAFVLSVHWIQRIDSMILFLHLR
jgi:hypothetical protein